MIKRISNFFYYFKALYKEKEFILLFVKPDIINISNKIKI